MYHCIISCCGCVLLPIGNQTFIDRKVFAMSPIHVFYYLYIHQKILLCTRVSAYMPAIPIGNNATKVSYLRETLAGWIWIQTIWVQTRQQPLPFPGIAKYKRDQSILNFLTMEHTNDMWKKFRSHTNMDNSSECFRECCISRYHRPMNATKHVFTVQCIFPIVDYCATVLLFA